MGCDLSVPAAVAHGQQKGWQMAVGEKMELLSSLGGILPEQSVNTFLHVCLKGTLVAVLTVEISCDTEV